MGSRAPGLNRRRHALRSGQCEEVEVGTRARGGRGDGSDRGRSLPDRLARQRTGVQTTEPAAARWAAREWAARASSARASASSARVAASTASLVLRTPRTCGGDRPPQGVQRRESLSSAQFLDRLTGAAEPSSLPRGACRQMTKTHESDAGQVERSAATAANENPTKYCVRMCRMVELPTE
jgi:hypothetical protein